MIELRAVTPANYESVLTLKVGPGQEGFVAPPVKTIADAMVYAGYEPLAIIQDETVVGIAMWGRDPDDGRYHIVRLMIDAAHQRKGYGREAAGALVKLISGQPECREIFLSFVPANTGARALYESIGFQLTGDTVEGETVMRLRL